MIRLVMRASDGRGKSTLLTEAVLEALDVPSVDELLRNLYLDKIPRKKIMALVPILFKTAEKGDEVARELIIMMGIETGVTARALIRRLGLEEQNPEVVLGGSVYKGEGSLLLNTIKSEIHKNYPGVHVKKPQFEPVVGAGLLALESIGVEVNEKVMGRLAETLPEQLKIDNKTSNNFLEANV